jgi:hypothetical protein
MGALDDSLCVASRNAPGIACFSTGRTRVLWKSRTSARVGGVEAVSIRYVVGPSDSVRGTEHQSALALE